MSQPTKTTQSDIFNTQLNIEKTHKQNSSQTVTNEPITNTPFRIIGFEREGWAIVIGQKRLTEWKKTKEEALEELNDNKWNVLGAFIIAMIQAKEEMKKEERQ